MKGRARGRSRSSLRHGEGQARHGGGMPAWVLPAPSKQPSNETGTGKWGANMRLVSGFGCFVCSSLAVLLCAASANPDRHVKAALAPVDAIAALAHSDAALATPELRTALADSDGATLADPVIKVPLVEPAVSVSPLEAADECLAAQDCIDQYLWS